MQLNVDSVSVLQVQGGRDAFGHYKAQLPLAFADLKADFHGRHPAPIAPTMAILANERLDANSWMVVPRPVGAGRHSSADHDGWRRLKRRWPAPHKSTSMPMPVR